LLQVKANLIMKANPWLRGAERKKKKKGKRKGKRKKEKGKGKTQKGKLAAGGCTLPLTR